MSKNLKFFKRQYTNTSALIVADPATDMAVHVIYLGVAPEKRIWEVHHIPYSEIIEPNQKKYYKPITLEEAEKLNKYWIVTKDTKNILIETATKALNVFKKGASI